MIINTTAAKNLLRNFSFKMRTEKIIWTIGVFTVSVDVNINPFISAAL